MIGLGSWMVLAGSVVFFAGAAYGVPRVFAMRSPEERLAALQARAGAWRNAQWLYAAGPVLVGSGVLTLSAGYSGQARLLAGAGGLALLVGAVFWSISCARRARRIEAFARGELPAGAWLAYVWLTIAGLALLGLASLGFEAWVGVMLLVAAGVFGAWFVIARDIPPFVFYLVSTVFGVWSLLAARS